MEGQDEARSAAPLDTRRKGSPAPKTASINLPSNARPDVSRSASRKRTVALGAFRQTPKAAGGASAAAAAAASAAAASAAAASASAVAASLGSGQDLSVEDRLSALRLELERDVKASPRTSIASPRAPPTPPVEEVVLPETSIFEAGAEMDTFVSRFMARRGTMRVSRVLSAMGLQHADDAVKGSEWKDVVPPTEEPEKIPSEEVAAEVAAADDWAPKAEEGLTAGEGIDRMLFLHNRSLALHQTRTEHVLESKKFIHQAETELLKLTSRHDSKIRFIANTLSNYKRDCEFFKKGLERQSGIQLANVSNKGWFKTGQGGTVDLTKIMEPFINARGGKNVSFSRASSSRFRANSEPPERKILTLSNTRPLAGGPPSRSSSMALNTGAFVGDIFNRRKTTTEQELIKAKMKELYVLKKGAVDYSVSPLQLALLQLELFTLTKDESIFDIEDRQILFPKTDMTDLLPLLGHRESITESALKNNRIFTHVYARGTFEGEGQGSRHDARFLAVCDLLNKRIEELRDDEDLLVDKVVTAQEQFLQRMWMPSSLKNCLIDRDELLRIVRKSYYENKARVAKLRSTLPGGLSAIPLPQPPPPRRMRSYARGSSEPPSRKGSPTHADRRIQEAPTTAVEQEEFYISAANLRDRDFTEIFLKAVGVNPQSILAKEGLAKTVDEPIDYSSGTKLPVYRDSAHVQMFSCHSTLAEQLLHFKTPLDEVFSTNLQPDVVLQVDRRSAAADVDPSSKPAMIEDYYELYKNTKGQGRWEHTNSRRSSVH